MPLPSTKVRNLTNGSFPLMAADGKTISIPARSTVPVHDKFLTWVKPNPKMVRQMEPLSHIRKAALDETKQQQKEARAAARSDSKVDKTDQSEVAAPKLEDKPVVDTENTKAE